MGPAFKALGFSSSTAESYARMTGATVDDPDFPSDPVRGTVRLEDYEDYIAALVVREPAPA